MDVSERPRLNAANQSVEGLSQSEDWGGELPHGWKRDRSGCSESFNQPTKSIFGLADDWTQMSRLGPGRIGKPDVSVGLLATG